MKVMSLFLLLLYTSAIANPERGKLLFQIDFQDFYQEDILSLKIGDVILVNEHILTSDPSDGLTDMFLFFYKEKNKIRAETSTHEVYYIPNTSPNLELHIFLNGKETVHVFNRKKGKYLGISKWDDTNKLDIIQSKRHFQYE